MGIIILIALLIIAVIIIVTKIKQHLFVKYVIKQFDNCNCNIFGKQGYGKDLFTQIIIKLRKKFYYGNLDYGYKFNGYINVSDLNVSPNTYDNLITGDILPIGKTFEEGCDFYLSDVGNILPSQYDYLLHKKYPSFPIFFALSRQLYNAHVHSNSQALERPWKVLREQSDFYIQCLGVSKGLGTLKVHIRTYEKYESAKSGILPLKLPLRSGKEGKVAKAQFDSTYGIIKEGCFKIRIKDIKYDSRYFHELFFNYPAPKKTKRHKNK